MGKDPTSKSMAITPNMTVLDVVSKYRPTEAVFKKYDSQAGVCICCEALFERLDVIAAKYDLDLDALLDDLKAVGQT